METRANYALIGVFTLATIAAAFGFVYWFTNVSGGGARATYQVEFGAPVSGLRGGSAVTFNGIRVGEVVRIALAADNPRQVMATIRVDSAAPVRADTSAILEFQGLTGLATLAL
ncbi:MAG: MCE family protein, partial [Proteobacteria bacterium]|nr:MCE family protein [Pseudomonadota bacterium]